jgi:hypothetical protein
MTFYSGFARACAAALPLLDRLPAVELGPLLDEMATVRQSTRALIAALSDRDMADLRSITLDG